MLKHSGEHIIADLEMEALRCTVGGFEVRTAKGLALVRKVSDYRLSSFLSELTLQFQESGNPSDAQALQALMASFPRVARRGRGRPHRSWPTTVLGNTT